MRVTVAVVATLLAACAWVPLQRPVADPAAPLPDRVRVWTTDDSLFTVDHPRLAGDSLTGVFQFLPTGGQANQGAPAMRTLPLTRVREVQQWTVTPGGVLGGVVVAALGWCVGGSLNGRGCFK